MFRIVRSNTVKELLAEIDHQDAKIAGLRSALTERDECIEMGVRAVFAGLDEAAEARDYTDYLEGALNKAVARIRELEMLAPSEPAEFVL